MEQKAESNNREPWLDEVKGLLIFMVVFGHMTSGIPVGETGLGFLRYLIYGMHMPMFILISGYLSKRGNSLRKIFWNLFVPYIVFDFLFVLVTKVFGGSDYTWNILYPAHALWYILCLAIMRLIISYLPRKSLPWILFGCFVLALLSTQLSENTWRFLSLGRIVLLFPIFYVGYSMPPDKMRTIRSGKRRWAILGILLLVTIEWLLLHYKLVDGSATHNYTDAPIGVLIKYFYMVLTLFWFACFSTLVSGRSSMLSRWGRNSLIIYLLHMYFVLVCHRLFKVNDEWLMLILMGVGSFVITDLLSLDIFKSFYDKIHFKIIELIERKISKGGTV